MATMAEERVIWIAELREYLENAGASFVKKNKAGHLIYKTSAGVWLTLSAIGATKVRIVASGSCTC
jgi:hypothetical protein